MMHTKGEKTRTIPCSRGEQQAQEKCGTTRRALAFYNKQMRHSLNPLMRAFIARQEMAFMATADAQGGSDCSFRAGLSGFVHVIDDTTLAYPEYRGNGVMASVGNIMKNPHIGILFLDFFQSTVGLHGNGTARILSNDDLLARLDATPERVEAAQATGGRRPKCWILVEVEEAYIHCSKLVPLLQKRDKAIHWGTNETSHKGGDYFKAKTCPRP